MAHRYLFPSLLSFDGSHSGQFIGTPLQPEYGNKSLCSLSDTYIYTYKSKKDPVMFTDIEGRSREGKKKKS